MKKTQFFLWLMLMFAVDAAQKQNPDEGRPYEFGFTIEGEQHRHEKKDENGIIQGEFGFITADGVYHTTVYATDENGNFRILSMRNVRISAPLDGSPGPGPGSARSNQAGLQGPPSSKLQAAPSPNQQNGLPQGPPIASTTTSRYPRYPFTTQPTIKPACGGCGYVTTQKPIPGQKFQFQNPQFRQNDAQATTPAPNYQQPGFNQNRVQDTPSLAPDAELLPPGTNLHHHQANINQNKDFNPAFRTISPDKELSPPGSTYNQNRPVSLTNQGITSPPFESPTLPPTKDLLPPGSNSYKNQNNPIPITNQRANIPPFETPTLSPNKELLPPGIDKTIAPHQFNTNQNIHQNGTIQEIDANPLNIDEEKGPETRVSLGNGIGGPNIRSSLQETKPVSKLPPVAVSNGVIKVGGKHPQEIPIRDKFPGMSDGLPEGVSEADVKDLLYKFHYTVGFHGHYEKGLKNGAKVGGYFVNGRDGISRVVTYVADENGYRPKFKFINLGLDSPETPKEDTEKTFGLKSFEFVWYPVES